MRDLNRRRFRILLVCAICSLPFVATGAMEALKTNANSPLDWVTTSFAPKATYENFRSKFGAGDVVVASWPECTIHERRLDKLLSVLRRAKGFHSSDYIPYFERVVCGREQYEKLISEPISLSEQEAIRRLRGALIGKDGEQTCVVVTFSTEGLANRAEIVPLIREAIVQFCEVPSDAVHMAGPVIDGFQVDQASELAMQTFAPISSVLVLMLCWVCLDSIIAAVLVFGVATFCQAITLSLIHYCDDTMTALLIVMPPLIQVLAVAGGIHLVNYYFENVRQSNIIDPVTEAFKMGWLPCTLSSATTAIGLGSLMISRLVPVRSFGGYAATGVIVTLCVLLSFIPGCLLFIPIRPPSLSNNQLRQSFWQFWTKLLCRYRNWISVISIAGIALMAYGATQVKASVRIETFFSRDSQILSDYRWIEEHVCALVPIEVIVTCEEDCSLNVLERLHAVAAIETSLREVSEIDGVLSAVDFLPDQSLAEPESSVERELKLRQLHASKDTLVGVNFLAVGKSQESWRVTGFVSALGNTDYGEFLSEIESHVQAHLDKEGLDLSGMTVEFTGIMPLVHEIQRQLLHDLFSSFLTAFGIIAVVMILVHAGVVSGLVAMIPNVFPTLILFGGFGWTQFPMDIGSVMTASIALGIAVDDTLHFLTFFRRYLASGESRNIAVLEACRHCGPAMIQTTIVCGLGLFAFAFAAFVPTARFAWMMLSLLTIALIGDLVLLPSLLLGPLGKFFDEPARHQ